MFRKPKRKAKDALRKKDDNSEDQQQQNAFDTVETGTNNICNDDDDDDKEEDAETSELLQEARKRGKGMTATTTTFTKAAATKKDTAVMHTYEVSKQPGARSLRDLVTSTAEHHPAETTAVAAAAAAAALQKKEAGSDGIYRGEKEVRNPFHAGPIRAAAHVRVTARFDYQPDVCKDYKETGFCGYGDTCIYLHDRGDTVSGWQLERQWELQQEQLKKAQEKEMNEFAITGNKLAAATSSSAFNGTTAVDLNADGIPFACHLCRGHFREPVATNCYHYFCEACIMHHVRTVSEACPVCGKDTGSVFNLPTKLMAKRRKVLGAAAAKQDDSWELYFKRSQGGEV